MKPTVASLNGSAHGSHKVVSVFIKNEVGHNRMKEGSTLTDPAPVEAFPEKRKSPLTRLIVFKSSGSLADSLIESSLIAAK